MLYAANITLLHTHKYFNNKRGTPEFNVSPHKHSLTSPNYMLLTSYKLSPLLNVEVPL